MCLVRMLLPLSALFMISTFANASVHPNGLRIAENGRNLLDCNCEDIPCSYSYSYGNGTGPSYKPKDDDDKCFEICCEDGELEDRMRTHFEI